MNKKFKGIEQSVNDYIALGKFPLSEIVSVFGEAWVRRWVALNSLEVKRVLSSIGL